MELYTQTIRELHKQLRAGDITSREITESVLTRIETVEPTIHAYIRVLKEEALAQADEIDEQLRKGDIELTYLTGIPLAVKDVMCTQGVTTTCGSKILENFVPPYDATAIRKLRQQHPVLIGKANMDEFAMGSSTENSAFGVTKNPWDIERVPGGSSGGSAAAVAAGEAIAALGTDTGGSIRQPAAFCNITGLKPTYGRVSRYGLVAYASSLDQIGPLTKDVFDSAILLQAISGHDPLDSTSVDVPVPDYTAALDGDISGMTIGIPREFFAEGIHPEIEQCVRQAITTLEQLGATCREVSLPHTDSGVATYYIIAPSEASSNLARYDGVKYGYRTDSYSDLMEMYTKTRAEGFGAEVIRRIMLGTYALSSGYYDAYYLKAQKVRTLVRRDYEQVFKDVDVLATPITPTPPFKIGEMADDPLTMYLGDVYTIPLNLAGVTGMSIPCGFTGDGLPVGLQLIGGHFEEEKVLCTAYAFQEYTDFHKKQPEVCV
ncbi:Asp-tRNA(Asn)/Glu-tRNA(Gln) amidotransferase GatCAB subunit A [candidate division KSB3 bacterium]|uniref:Glutamyl-tRNA(Gln) amidotransferase subunit A n=1 Tax=candidate division KSB3 bacterium TaxID=2044937 RepID=A0A2G6KLZ4_9BACT|nr:MAG: Asp-tRNA(Asn)/Glu-tRNA(Gln) amidotransferase GatCAB subunit A [candidate division KSB3 bacterium]